MARFDVTIRQTLSLYGEVTVSAKDEDTAREKVERLIDDGKIPELSWSVVGNVDWNAPDPVEMVIDEVNEQ